MKAKEKNSDSGFSVETEEQLAKLMSETKYKKKIALIGPAIDRLASHVRWGNRLSSSFYRTIGLNISLRTVTKTTEMSKTSFDFVIWQFSPRLSPSLLKRLIRGASALIVAVETCHTAFEEEIEDNADSSDAFTDDRINVEHFFAHEAQATTQAELHSFLEQQGDLDLAMIEKSASHLKLPIAFIHFVERDSHTLATSAIEDVQTDKTMALTHKTEAQYQDIQPIKLRETEHSLHLGVMTDENSEYCLGQAFDYIAGHFASAA